MPLTVGAGRGSAALRSPKRTMPDSGTLDQTDGVTVAPRGRIDRPIASSTKRRGPAKRGEDGRAEFIPDVIVVPASGEQARCTGTPVLAIEVLSTNRSDDLILQTGRYAAAGLPHYWIVDPRDRTFSASSCRAVCTPGRVPHQDRRAPRLPGTTSRSCPAAHVDDEFVSRRQRLLLVETSGLPAYQRTSAPMPTAATSRRPASATTTSPAT